MITVYGIPTCATVKKARAALDDKGTVHSFIDFRKTPPSADQVKKWVAKFGFKAMRNLAGGSYRALGDEKDSWTEQQWTDAYTRDPMLIKRPIIERDGAPVLVGFQPADVKAAGQ